VRRALQRSPVRRTVVRLSVAAQRSVEECDLVLRADDEERLEAGPVEIRGEDALAVDAVQQVWSVPADSTYTMTVDGPPVAATTTVSSQNASVSFAGTAGQKVSVQ
jgi:hypothetical protein